MRRRVPRFFAVGVLLFCVAVSTACEDDGTVIVKKLSLMGVTAVDEGKLKAALATKESSIIPWGKKQYFDRSRFDADLKRLVAFYADRGYPDARVSSFDVHLNDKQNAVDISVTIDEGAPVLVASVGFDGFGVIPEDRLAELKNRTPLKVGAPRDRQQVVSTHELAVNELRDHGYPYAKVETKEDDGADGKTASLSFVAEPGKIARFGPVEIAGNKSVSVGVIRRELAYQPGDLYRRSLVQDTQRRLYRMELFQFANVEPLNSEAQPEEVPTRITVAEGKHQRVNFGVGYGTEEKGRVEAEYRQLNFLGGARSAGAHVRWSSLDRGVRLDFNQPYFFSSHFSMGGEVQQWYTYTPAYQSIVSGGKATLTHRANANTSWSVALTSERDSSHVSQSALDDPSLYAALIALGLNPITGEQVGTLNALSADVQHSTADSPLDAHRGYQIAFHTEQAGRFLPGSFNYYAVSVDGRHYLPLGDKVTIASRLQIGGLRPTDNQPENVPFGKRLFLGGATSVRGWGRYEISPLSPSGQPIGGDSLLAASVELRAPLHGNFGGVVFVDAGNVWADPWGVKLDELRYAVGPGLRYQTPIGPVRFDLGYQLNPIPGLVVNGEPQARRWRIHFSIGQAF